MNSPKLWNALGIILALCLLAVIFPSPSKSQDVPAALAAISRDLAQPADEIHLVDGKKVPVTPFANIPRTGPKSAGTLDYELLERPGQVLQIRADEIGAILFFETAVLEKVDRLLKPAAKDGQALIGHAELQEAEKILQALGTFHDSRRAHAPLAPNPWAALHGRVADKLVEVRRQRLALYARTASGESEWTEALRLADTWLPLGSSVRDQVRAFWIHYGEVKLKDGDLSKVRAICNRLDEHFLQSSQAEPLRRALQAKALTLGKEAKDLPVDQAIRTLEEALALWPRAPGLRDDLEKRKQTYRVVYVAVRHLPENLSPATAWTNAEQQALDLLFNRLVQVQFDPTLGQNYVPDLITELPRADGASRHIKLRRDTYWSDGDRLSTTDVRHTAQLLGPTSSGRDLVDVPRSEGDPFALTFTLKQGLLDPLAPLRFHVLPRNYRGQPLARADDPEFARVPVGSGPFQYVGRQQEGARTVAVFRANPNFDRSDKKHHGSVREIRLLAWSDPQRDLGQPRPHLVLDVPARSVDALKKMGYADVHSVAGRRVNFLAVNHRVSSLSNLELRRALAHAIDRGQILKDHFRGPEAAAKLLVPLSGPFPARSWASCSTKRVPEDPYQPELAKSLAKKAGQALGPIRLTLKFPADEPGVKEACAAIAEQAAKVFTSALTIQPMPLSPQQMRDALRKRDYELAYHHWDFPDDNFWLWPIFDPHPDARRPGGSNFLGYVNDSTLESLLHSAMSHRHFPDVREFQHNIHYHVYERMPLIPLWQLPENFAVAPSLTVPSLDPQRVFANILEWKVNP